MWYYLCYMTGTFLYLWLHSFFWPKNTLSEWNFNLILLNFYLRKSLKTLWTSYIYLCFALSPYGTTEWKGLPPMCATVHWWPLWNPAFHLLSLKKTHKKDLYHAPFFTGFGSCIPPVTFSLASVLLNQPLVYNKIHLSHQGPLQYHNRYIDRSPPVSLPENYINQGRNSKLFSLSLKNYMLGCWKKRCIWSISLNNITSHHTWYADKSNQKFLDLLVSRYIS